VPTSSPPAAPLPPRSLITAARFSQAPFRVRAEVDESVVGRVALTNTGETTIGAVSFRLEGGHAGDFAVGGPCQRMAPRSGCTVAVSFAPREAGPRAVTLIAESQGMLLDSKELIGDALAPPRLVDVPRLIGSDRDAAIRRLKERGLAAGTTTEAPQCESVGRVVAQNPEQHRRVAEGTPVDITVASHGPEPAVVPDVRQQPRAVAERMLRAARLSIAATSRNDITDSAPPGSVTDVRPRPGTTLAPDCPVTLSIAVATPKIVVPSYVGQTLAAAKQRLGTGILGAFATFRLGQVSTTDGSAVRRGEDAELIVVEQSPPAGSQQPRGTPIDLKVRRMEGQILRGRPIERAPAPAPPVRVPDAPVIR
jgi:beta-lactam-binding protein with PASTA domain